MLKKLIGVDLVSFFLSNSVTFKSVKGNICQIYSYQDVPCKLSVSSVFPSDCLWDSFNWSEINNIYWITTLEKMTAWYPFLTLMNDEIECTNKTFWVDRVYIALVCTAFSYFCKFSTTGVNTTCNGKKSSKYCFPQYVINF